MSRVKREQNRNEILKWILPHKIWDFLPIEIKNLRMADALSQGCDRIATCSSDIATIPLPETSPGLHNDSANLS